MSEELFSDEFESQTEYKDTSDNLDDESFEIPDESDVYMDEPEELDEEEKRRLEERAKRRERMRREKELQLRRRRFVMFAVPICGILLTFLLVYMIISGARERDEKKQLAENLNSTQVSGTDITLDTEQGEQNPGAEEALSEQLSDGTGSESDLEANSEQTDSEVSGSQADGEKLQIPDTIRYQATFGEAVDGIDEEEVNSSYAIIIEENSGQVLAAKQAKTRISPASMTKILTVLVAAEFVEDLDDTVTITREETDYAFSNDCSAVNFDIGEVVTVRDLFYGTILPSGADAALALAKYVAGSQEAFVDLMNEKLKAMGLSASTHFTNCVGLYDENHYSTVYDMAMILQAAVNNDICKEVLKAHTYTTSQTASHPNGITISNWFLRRIEDKDTHGEVLCAKTGFVVESRNCAASYAQDHSGNGYYCVTADAYNGWRCIYDHVALYQKYLK